MKEKFGKILPAVNWVLLGMLLAFGLVVLLFGGFKNFYAAQKSTAILRIIERDYVADYDIDTLTDAACSAMISQLDDNWSYYMDAQTYASYQDYAANQYQGIGVTIAKDEATGGFLVVSINKGGPAQTVGMVDGDIILAVDGISVTEGDASDLRALVQADYGENAIITALRESGETVDFTVSCEEVYSSPVAAQLLDNGVGYISIANFRSGAGGDAIAAVEDMIAKGARSLVFDVRENPGGQVTELVELLDYLLPEGDIFIRADKTGRESVTESDASCVEMPMAVIVDANSYSAAEFFAAAMKEYDWAVIVGEHTTGKARSQVTIPLTDGSAVHISKYNYLTPKRTDLYEAGGLAPDVEVSLSEEELEQFTTGWLEPADDPQVMAAVEALSA